MKNYKKNQIIIVLVFLLSIIGIILNYSGVVLPTWLLYIVFFSLGFSICAELLIYIFKDNYKKLQYLENKISLWNSISYRVKNAGEVSFNEMPLGIIVFNSEYEIEWANNYAKEIFMSPLVNRDLRNIDASLTSDIQNKKEEFNLVLYGKTYLCKLLVESNILYLTDITEKMAVLKRYKDRTLVIGIVNLDNFSEALSTFDAKDRSLQITNLIGILTEWAEKYNICIKSYTEERYMLIMDQATLNELMKTDFEVLDDIHDYFEKEGIRITASMGIACGDIPATTLLDVANNQIELALNRGGNQAVVKIDDDITYYGGKSSSFENRTSVQVRIKAEELRDLIINSSNVFIMSHKEMDADGFGASLALYKVIHALGKEAKILLDEKQVDTTVRTVYQSIKTEHMYLLNSFIECKESLSQVNENSLLIIIDCQYQNIVMYDKLYKKTQKIAIIDHHRRGGTAISNYSYLYTQPSSSSSVELIIEMIDYLKLENIDISSIEATWMLMGVIVDTNNFIYRTTNRTFNVLAKLQSYGADMSKVQRYLREDFSDYVKRMAILNNMEIVNGVYGVAVCDEDVYDRTFIAKIADNLISVDNIKIAFCIGKIESDIIGISARSLDEGNAQIIMEKMGGGGHYNNAATQLKGMTLQEAKELLISNLEQEKKGDVSMKIILTKNVKGKGKVNDIIDIPAGHANFLLHSNQAIEATPDNIKHLEESQLIEKENQEKHLKDMQELKKKVESLDVKIGVKVGQSGKLFGTVSTKQIVDEFKLQHGIELDKRKILFDKTIDALGTYKIPIQLHKEVTATITIYVIEKE